MDDDGDNNDDECVWEAASNNADSSSSDEELEIDVRAEIKERGEGEGARDYLSPNASNFASRKRPSKKGKQKRSSSLKQAEMILACARLRLAVKNVYALSENFDYVSCAFSDDECKTIQKCMNLKTKLKAMTEALRRRRGREHRQVSLAALRSAIVSNRKLKDIVAAQIFAIFLLSTAVVEDMALIYAFLIDSTWLQVGPYYCDGTNVTKEIPPHFCFGIDLKSQTFFGVNAKGAWFQNTLFPALNNGNHFCKPRGNDALLPRTKADFEKHSVYILNPIKAAIHKDAKPYTYFEGKPVYLRAQVDDLRGERKWKLEFRKVKDNEQPIWGSLYARYQTETWEPEPCINDIIPTNKHGNVDIVNADPRLVPPGTEWIQHQHAIQLCRKLHIPYAPVITGFTKSTHPAQNNSTTPSLYHPSRSTHFSSTNRQQKPIKKGVVVPLSYAPQLKSQLLAHDQHRISLQHQLKRRKITFRWATLVSKFLSKARLHALYLPSSSFS
mmetsp:Transcript_7621/g.11448  ORF Transcript_7621/g.11448 Transcript_7621/m.11448 type:complete len:498 (+) Transcript_7621:1-1494(+)